MDGREIRASSMLPRLDACQVRVHAWKQAGHALPPMSTADGASDLQPGAEVILTGLKGNAALNGEQGIVQTREEWPSHENRIAVMG